MEAAREPDQSDRSETHTTRRRYNRHARFYDIEQGPLNRFTGRLRRELWAKAPSDRMLEVGVGTGLNIQHYPEGSKVIAIDISERMLDRARARAAKLEVPVDLALMDVEHLDFADSSFDSAVATFTFCSVPHPIAGLQEVRRVLKPEGRLLLLEHVRGKGRVAGKVMDLLNPLAVRATGANINRRTADNVERAGLEVLGISERLRGIVQLIEARRPC